MKNLKRNWTIRNRKASYDYFFLKTYVAGMQLNGLEVKQIRNGKASIADAFCYIHNDEIFLKGCHIQMDNGQDPYRVRKLLLNKKEILKLKNELIEGMTIIPSKLFENDKGFLKIEINLSKGKKSYDKRNSLKEKETKKEIDRL